MNTPSETKILDLYQRLWFIFLGMPQGFLGIVQLFVRKENGDPLALADHRKGTVAVGYC